MNSPVFEQEFLVRYHQLDSHGSLRPVMLLNFLQDAAGLHATRLGVSVLDLRRTGLTWVLSRIHLVMQRYPRADERVVITTWPSTREGLFSCREFELRDGHNQLIGGATTSWAVLDVATRRPVKLDRHLASYPLVPRRAINDDFASLPLFPEHATGERSFRVLRGDLDSNQHVNNTVFSGWALETLPDDVAAGTSQSLEVSFRAEALYGDTVLSRYAVVEPGVFLHQIVNRADGRELARLRTCWQI